MIQSLMFLLSIIVGLLVLGLLVLVHELGHFLAAKACKIKVMAFAIGFGKPLYKFKRREDGTEYRINTVPFGGYVAMASDSPVGETMGGDNEFNSHPIWQRAFVAIAGPAANFVFALLTLWLMFVCGVDRPVYLDSARIGGVVAGSAADSAGFKAGDSIVGINGALVDTWEHIESRLSQQLDSYSISVWRDNAVFEFDLRMEKLGARLPAYPTGGLLPVYSPPIIGGVVAGGSADGVLKAGDSIVSVNGAAIVSFGHLASIIKDYDQESGPMAVNVTRGGETLSLELTPAFDSERGSYMLGIQGAPSPTRRVRYGPFAAIEPTISKSWEFTTMIFDVLGKLTSGAVSANQLAGPLNIIPVSGLMAFQGLSTILNFMALIGINLAVLNLLPLVITDGGLLMFLGIEAIRGKPLPIKAQAIINKIFMALFIGLFLFVSFNDVQRLPDFFKMLK